jgi:hypothetical protein
MALTSQDIDNLDAAIATGELEVEVNGRRVKYRSISELKAAREHVASVLQRDGSAPRRAVFRVNFSTSRD